MALPDPETCYRAVQSRDPRFDGWFITAVSTTGIYCRPSCPAITPHRRNVTFHLSAAAAQRAGYRACKRCRPDTSPGSPEWNLRGDLAGRAMRLIADGAVDRDGVPGLAARLGYSERHVHRVLMAEVGAGPLALARSQRAHTARTLLETTDLAITDLAFAAGFSSVRQFNDTVREVYASTPRALRAGRRHPVEGEPGTVTLKLPYRRPMELSTTLAFLNAEAVPGLQAGADEKLARVVDAPYGPSLVTVSPGNEWVTAKVRLTDTRDLATVVARVRRLLDLDADPAAIDATLGADPALAPLVHARPGLRAPGCVDGFEAAVRVVAGRGLSPDSTRTRLRRLLEQHGTLAWEGEPWRVFPRPETLAAIDPAALPVSEGRGRAITAIANAVAHKSLDLDAGTDRDHLRTTLRHLPGVGVAIADHVLMRASGHPDVLLASEVAVRDAADTLGINLAEAQQRWSPWRTYATRHLWDLRRRRRDQPAPVER